MRKDKICARWYGQYLSWVVFIGLPCELCLSKHRTHSEAAAITQQITEIQDIERLRKVALLLVHNSDEW